MCRGGLPLFSSADKFESAPAAELHQPLADDSWKLHRTTVSG
jgi:hypothetical protein